MLISLLFCSSFISYSRECCGINLQVNDEFMRTLEIVSKKLKFVEVDPMVKTSVALKDVLPELERLRQKAVSKVVE